MVDKVLVETLAKAKAYVERGWCRGHYLDGRDNVCAVGALELATGRSIRNEQMSLEYRGLYGLVCKVKDELYPASAPWHIESWNDDGRRTKEEVVCLLQKAIERAIKET